MKKFFPLAAVLGCAILTSCTSDPEVVVLDHPILLIGKAYWDCPHAEQCRNEIEILLPDGTIRTFTTENNSRFAIAKANYMDEISIRKVPNENACPIKSVHITGNNDITLYNLTDEWQTFTVKYDPNLD